MFFGKRYGIVCRLELEKSSLIQFRFEKKIDSRFVFVIGNENEYCEKNGISWLHSYTDKNKVRTDAYIKETKDWIHENC